jgi:hypothetical protein
MSISTVRYALISMMVTFGLIMSTAASGTAASTRAPVRFGAGSASLASSGTVPQCQTGAAVCASSDPAVTLAWSSAVSTAGCTFRLAVDWGDGTAAQTVKLTGARAATVWPVAHAYPGGVLSRHPYQITATATVTGDTEARGCSIQSAAVTFTLLCTDRQLSGAAWNARWPGGDSAIGHLNAEFGPRVTAFMSAMNKAGITVRPMSTLRSPQRSYLMHFSYLVAKGQIAASDVPAYVPIAGEKKPKICWAHRTTTGALDKKGSVASAKELLSALGVDASLGTPPALRSRHNTGDAIDMQIRWTATTVKVKTAAGKTVTIGSTPKDGTSPQLIAVGATYGVHHFAPVAVDRNHWSSDGH